MAGRNSVWFAAGPVNLHLGIEPNFHPAKRAHPAFVVDTLDDILAACKRAGLSVKPDTSFNRYRRAHVFDPFGNRLELMQPEDVAAL
jgi:predicted enzyme related to lactoylglutathione lyase